MAAAGAAQARGPTYRAEPLACAGFTEEVHTDIRVRRARGGVADQAGRTGIVRVRAQAQPGAGAIRFEVWYDSLAVWRDSPAGRLTPDTDGLVGGRWWGRLAPNGAAVLETRPFMPPEVRDVADLSETFSDFFPPLPAPESGAPLALGERWADTLGLEVTRLRDTVVGPRPVARYAWRSTAVRTADSGIRLGERLDDEGRLLWSDSLGPLGWTRTVTVRSQVRGGVRIGESLLSEVVQRILVRRILGDAACG